MNTRIVGCGCGIVLALSAVITACESAAAPCIEGQCTEALPDLTVVSVSVVSSVRDAQTGLAVVQPAAIDVRVVVRNDGDVKSEEKPLLLELGVVPTLLLTVPPLAPGAVYDRRVRLDGPAPGAFLIDSDTMRVVANVVTLDANTANNSRKSDAFHLAIPALRVRTTVDSAVFRANAGMPSSIMIDNVSRYATFESATFAYCIYDLGGLCTQTFRATAFGKTVLPAVPALQSLRLDYPVNVPSGAANQNRVASYGFGTCVAAGDVEAGTLPKAGTCFGVTQIQVRPDYEACDPVPLEAGKVAEANVVCSNPCDIYTFSVRTEVGKTYRIESATGGEDRTLRWRTRYRDNPVDASPAAGFQPAVADTYYLVTEPKYCGALGARNVVLRVTP